MIIKNKRIVIMKDKQQYLTIRTVLKFNRNRGKIDTLNAQIHDRSLSWIDTGMSRKSGAVKLLKKWCGNAGVFDISVKCQPLQIYFNWLNNFVFCPWFFSVSVKKTKTLNRPSGWFQERLLIIRYNVISVCSCLMHYPLLIITRVSSS